MALAWVAFVPHGHCQPPPEPERILHLDRGERAPHEGFLLVEAAVVDWTTRIRILEERLRIEGEAAQARAAVHAELEEARLGFERDRRTLETSLYRERLQEVIRALAEARADQGLSFWQWLGLGVVAAAIASAGVVIGASL